jgi:hypothetical protein
MPVMDQMHPNQQPAKLLISSVTKKSARVLVKLNYVLKRELRLPFVLFIVSAAKADLSVKIVAD